jgi:hypothetical protein
VEGAEVRLGDVAGDGEAEAGASAVAAAGRVQPDEAVEDAFTVGLGDPISVVRHGQLGAIAFAAHLDLYRLLGVSLGVVEQIGEHPADLGRDGVDGHSRLEPEADRDAVGPPGDLGSDQFGQVHPLQAIGQARFHPGQEEQISDDRIQPVDVDQRSADQVIEIGLVGMQPGLLQFRAEPGDGVAELV